MVLLQKNNLIKKLKKVCLNIPWKSRKLEVRGIIIRLRKNENAEKSKNKLIAMLEELLKREPVSLLYTRNN